MPELPEVEQTRLSLLPIRGKTIASVSIFRADICESFSGSGAPLKHSNQCLLQGAVIASLVRRGKQLALVASDSRTLCIQLGMSGNMRLLARKMPRVAFSKHTHAAWTFSDGSQLLFIDPRRFGGLSTYPTFGALEKYRWSTLGPDALTISARDLANACAKSRRPIKALLLDQAALAGVGNIYADESLFRADIHPRQSAHSLDPKRLTNLASAIRHILAHAIKAGGSTLRDYADSSGVKGKAQLLHAVYGRAHQPCLRCGRTLKFFRLAQRATVYCSFCQTMK